MNDITMLTECNQSIEAGRDQADATVRTEEPQVRPALMTCAIIAVGLLPAALSTAIGSQVQRPLAVVVVSGMMLAPAIILIALPALISLFPGARDWG